MIRRIKNLFAGPEPEKPRGLDEILSTFHETIADLHDLAFDHEETLQDNSQRIAELQKHSEKLQNERSTALNVAEKLASLVS